MSRQPEKKPRADRFGMPPLANPYDLSTWQAERTGPRTGRPEPQDQDRRRSERHVQASARTDRKSTRLNSSHVAISYAVFCLKKKIMDFVCARLPLMRS